jgi:hypothetical protein
MICFNPLRCKGNLSLVTTLILLSTGLALAQNRFFKPLSSSIAGSQQDATLIDVNRDGKLDIISHTNSSTGTTFSVSFGRGDGTFAYPAKTIVTLPGNAFYRYVVGDFNRDGVPDLVVSTALSGSSSVLARMYRGNGDGTFTAFSQYAFSGAVRAAGDFNRDGNLDLLTDSPDDSHSGVVLGDGMGHFGKELVIALGNQGLVGDFNGDGKLDYLTTPQDSSVAGGNALQIMLGDGRGAFMPGSTIDVGKMWTGTAAVADFDRDGVTDIVIANESNDSAVCGPGSISVRASSGTYDPNSMLAGYSPQSFVIGDLNGDGKPDILVLGSGNIIAFLNNGHGFTALGNYTSGSFATGVGIGDVNGDHKPDIVVYEGNGFNTLLGTGTTFKAYTTIGPGFVFLTGLASADLNHDGLADLVMASNDYGCRDNYSFGEMLVALGKPIVGPTSSSGGGYVEKNMGAGYPSIEIGDFNGDGKPDIGFGDLIYFGDGKGGFNQAPNTDSDYNNAPSEPYMVAGDFNGDGKADLVALDQVGLTSYLSKGDGSFTPKFVTDDNPEAATALQHDFNGDGKRDLLVLSPKSNSMSLFLGNGDGSFRPPHTYTLKSGMSGASSVADFNGDRKSDVAVAVGNQVAVLLGNGDGTFKTPTYVTVDSRAGTSLWSLATADLRGVGKTDLLAGDGLFFVLPGNGNGTFGTPLKYNGGGAYEISVGDFNGDGANDVALLSNGEVMMMYNQGGTRSSLSSSAATITYGHSVTFTARVLASIAGIPTGTVTFKDGATPLSTVTLSGGKAVYTDAKLTKGTHTISTTYSGDANFNPHGSVSVIEHVN